MREKIGNSVIRGAEDGMYTKVWPKQSPSTKDKYLQKDSIKNLDTEYTEKTVKMLNLHQFVGLNLNRVRWIPDIPDFVALLSKNDKTSYETVYTILKKMLSPTEYGPIYRIKKIPLLRGANEFNITILPWKNTPFMRIKLFNYEAGEKLIHIEKLEFATHPILQQITSDEFKNEAIMISSPMEDIRISILNILKKRGISAKHPIYTKDNW